jgi:PmbA protein
LRALAQTVLDHAAAMGATACEVDVSEGFGQSVSVRRQEVETIEYNRDKGLGVTAYIGQRRGHASSSDFSPAAVRASVEAALSIARFTAEDDCAGLPEAGLLAKRKPWIWTFSIPGTFRWNPRSTSRAVASRPPSMSAP